MTTTTKPSAARAGSAKLQSWQQYMTDLRAFAGAPLSLETQGTLVKVAGLVLEAAGIRVPVGSVCEVRMDGQPPVQAEVRFCVIAAKRELSPNSESR